MKPRFARAARPAATMAQDGSPRCILDSARRGARRRSEGGGVRGVGERTMSWYTSEQAFACKSATGSTDPLPRMRNASRIGCSERSLAAVAKLYGLCERGASGGSRGVPARGMHALGPRTNEINADTAHLPKGRKGADNGGARQRTEQSADGSTGWVRTDPVRRWPLRDPRGCSRSEGGSKRVPTHRK